MKQDTKNILIETGAQIIHHKGYNHTGIQEVLKAAGVPKGSFYFHFKNKEDFGLQVIEYFDGIYFSMLSTIINNNDITPLKKIEEITNYYISFFKEIDFKCGCPVGNLSQEMGDLNSAFSEKLTNSVEKMAKIYQNILDEAKLINEINEEINTQELSEFIVSSWHGALIKMKINKNAKPLELHKKFVLEILKK